MDFVGANGSCCASHVAYARCDETKQREIYIIKIISSDDRANEVIVMLKKFDVQYDECGLRFHNE